MKAAAPPALLSLPVKAGGSRASPAGAKRPAGTPADAFFRILSARLGRKGPRALRTQAGDGAQQGQAAPSQDAEPPAGKPAAEAAGEKIVLPQRKRAARGHGAAGEMPGTEAVLAQAGAEGAPARPARQAGPARDPLAATAAAGGRPAAPRVFVLDLRREPESQPAGAKAATSAAPAPGQGREADGPAGAGFGARLAAARDGGAGVRGSRAAAAAGAPFETALDRLRAMAGSEMVRASGIVLRDGGGEIRLVLRPESLGSVRIRMNLVDNGIEGRIIVDNAAVKQVLDGSLDALARALTAQGFQSAALEVAVGGQNADGGRQADEPHPALRRQSAEGFERNVPGIESLSLGDLLVNLFV